MSKNLSNIIIWAENKPGVLYRILWLFRRKQFNIESATAGHSEIPGISRITITVSGNENLVKNMCHQLTKLIEVVKVDDTPEEMLVSRELALMKVAVKNKNEKNDILRVIEHFRARVVNMTKNSLIIEVTGDEVKIDAFYEKIKDFIIIK